MFLKQFAQEPLLPLTQEPQRAQFVCEDYINHQLQYQKLKQKIKVFMNSFKITIPLCVSINCTFYENNYFPKQNETFEKCDIVLRFPSLSDVSSRLDSRIFLHLFRDMLFWLKCVKKVWPHAQVCKRLEPLHLEQFFRSLWIVFFDTTWKLGR